jgi:hypothetical protein
MHPRIRRSTTNHDLGNRPSSKDLASGAASQPVESTHCIVALAVTAVPDHRRRNYESYGSVKEALAAMLTLDLRQGGSGIAAPKKYWGPSFQ